MSIRACHLLRRRKAYNDATSVRNQEQYSGINERLRFKLITVNVVVGSVDQDDRAGCSVARTGGLRRFRGD